MAKNAFFYLVIFGVMFLCLEVFAFIVYLLVDRDDYFDHRDAVLARLNSDNLADFLEASGDPVLGWVNHGLLLREGADCHGNPVIFRYDDAGARTNEHTAPGPVEIVVVGDSYTDGDEVNYEASYPARLSSRLGVAVASHGVGGYGPTQSLLNLKSKRAT